MSVVTPFFNGDAAFEETAVSVFRQTLRQWEWIIVNDGSTDPKSLETLDRYRGIDPRVTVIDQDNRGPGAARNTGFSAAAADYVMQLDDDDQLEPTALEKLYWFLETNPGFAFAKGYTIGFGAETYIWPNGFHAGDAFLEQNHADVLVMIRRAVALAVGGYDEDNREGLEDWDFWLKLAAAGHWGGTIHEPLGWYRRRGSHTETWSNWDDGPNEQKFKHRLRKRYPELWRSGVPDPIGRESGPHHGFPDAYVDLNRLESTKRTALLIVPWLEVGGADRVNRQIVDGLISSEWDVTIVTTLPAANAWEDEFKQLTPDVFVLDRFLEIDDRPWFVDYLIESRSPDIVLVSNSWFGYDLLPFIRTRHADLPLVDLTHAEEEWNDGGFPGLSNRYERYLDLRITGSRHVRDWMVERGGRGDIAVWYTGVEVSRFEDAANTERDLCAESGLGPADIVILFVGRLADEKQPEVVVRVVDHLGSRGIHASAVLVGKGPNLETLKAETAARGLESQVRFETDAPDDRLVAWMSEADVFLLTSLREGIAVTIYEAMVSGLPVIATDVGGQGELVTDSTGYLLQDPAGHDLVPRIADTIAELVSDPTLGVRLGEAGRARIYEQFRADVATARFVSLLDDVVEAGRTGKTDTDARGGTGSNDTFDLTEIVERHRLIETQQRFTLDQWAMREAVSVSATRTEDGHVGRHARASIYDIAAKTLGAPYRWFKARNPQRATAIRDRVRSVLRYRR